MSAQQFWLWKLPAFMFFLCLVFGCGVRERSLNTQLKVVSTLDSLAEKHSSNKLVTKFYDDVLTGTFNPDTGSVDSASFESAGLKITLKAKGKKIDFTAQAKPVARSELTATDSSKTQVKAVQTIDFSQQIKQTVKPSPWPIWINILLIIGVLFLLGWAYKKIS
ncbi:hypothetical protein H7F33_05515 [Pedobacter sp. PAMC26386]|nr:hypothetical protein H7F33_05515 [Pedobacter sp. PAMC26386]